MSSWRCLLSVVLMRTVGGPHNVADFRFLYPWRLVSLRTQTLFLIYRHLEVRNHFLDIIFKHTEGKCHCYLHVIPSALWPRILKSVQHHGCRGFPAAPRSISSPAAAAGNGCFMRTIHHRLATAATDTCNFSSGLKERREINGQEQACVFVGKVERSPVLTED